jgi:hypothetical protein
MFQDTLVILVGAPLLYLGGSLQKGRLELAAEWYINILCDRFGGA